MLPASRLNDEISDAVADFATVVRPRLAADVDPEPQLYGPLEGMFAKVVRALGLEPVVYPQSRLPAYGVRPDFALQAGGSIVGYVEVKRPGRGADPGTWARRSRDYQQWDRLRLLPNVLYTDGDEWALYRSGERVSAAALPLIRDRRRRPPSAPAVSALSRVLQDFILWRPEPPTSVEQLVRSIAGLCRLLRDEVIEALRLERSGARPTTFTPLVDDWQRYLFPDSSVEEFADGYAQTVTFALLLARVDDVGFENRSLNEIAYHLGRQRSLMGRALNIFIDGLVTGYEVAVNTLVRVVGAVDWKRIEAANPSAYLQLYEPFLEAYDPSLRKRSGSYYTPPGIASFMVRFTDEVLRSRIGLRLGFGAREVVVVDPAMGTGTYLTAVMDSVRQTVAEEEGEEAVPAQLRSLAQRLIGLEKQMGPFAVAEWRVHLALRQLGALKPDEGVRLHVSDTLERPDEGLLPFPSWYEPIARSKREADRIKRDERVLVVIGNPPFGERAKGKGRWIEFGHPDSGVPAPLNAFRESGNGRHEHKLLNLYVYFWRWGTWKVFDAHLDSPSGVVAFLSTSGYLTGRGFDGMRRYLRQRADEGWIIDLTPEGNRPTVSSRSFSGVQRGLCIGIFARRGAGDSSHPARVQYLAAEGTRAKKLQRLEDISLDDAGWIDCPRGWRDPFLPTADPRWERCPALGDLMPWSSSGVKPNRTWVYAAEPATLRSRWRRLMAAQADQKDALLKKTEGRTARSRVEPLPGSRATRRSLLMETNDDLDVVEIAYRSFDRQWIAFDNRVIDRVRPELWMVQSAAQIYTSELHTSQLTSGPGVTFDACVPDMDYYKGNSGGRVLPLFRDSAAATPNVAPGITNYLSDRLGIFVTAVDLLAYIAAVVAHSGFTRHFREQLRTPGVHVPLTASAQSWASAVQIGREVLWIHTRGERFGDSRRGRPPGPPRLPLNQRPKVRAAIPHTPADMPDEIGYDPNTETLLVGLGRVGPVPPEVWNYEVSGMRVVRKWFGYRKRRPILRTASFTPLNDIRPTTWDAEMTTELLNLLNVLARVVTLEPAQDALLKAIWAGPLVTTGDLVVAGVFPIADTVRRPPPRRRHRTPPSQGRLPFDLPGTS